MGIDQETHKKLAVNLFNRTWDLIEKVNKSEDEKDEMMYSAIASRFHWGFVGTPLQFARGEWQISRVYSLLGRHEPAFHHARKSLEFCIENNLGDFDLGFAYEALARSYALIEVEEESRRYIQLAQEAATKISNVENREWLEKNIHSVETNSIPL
ncbi:hypothetical protein DS745_08130 [Anaerobacillus alkaliphilus]|uniref:Tetratricopeptide repeat protein n=1 Tax=Anaerobacillus alkaliphilus TaxID=1548597 RepID=A0A4Q0VUC9_9BACI|nr:hypothetical protein DS745_08130 [Anaerobacillus alkaliphilus]